MAYVISSDNFRIFYEIHNHKSKKPLLVFLHGLMGNSAALKKMTSFFVKRDFPVLTLDMRGHGKSSAFLNRDFYTFDKFVADVKNVLDESFPKRFFYLIGYSFGGMVALRFLELFPDRVERLVILNSFYKSPVGLVGGTKGFRNLVLFVEGFFAKYPLAEKFFHKVVGGLDYEEFSKLSDLSIFAKQVSNTRAKIIIYIIDSINKVDLSNFIHSIRLPTLIVSASDDLLFPAKLMRRMHRLIRGSHFVVLEGTHSLPVKKPEVVAEAILGFLAYSARKKSYS